MLSEDISRGIGNAGSAIGRVLTGAIRGALMFALLAAVIWAGASLLMPTMIALGIPGLGLGIASGLAAAAGTFATALTWIGIGAAAGAALFGVTSMIPGKSEGFGLKSRFSSAPPTGQDIPVPVRTPSVDTPDLEPEIPSEPHTNGVHAQRVLERRALAGESLHNGAGV